MKLKAEATFVGVVQARVSARRLLLAQGRMQQGLRASLLLLLLGFSAAAARTQATVPNIFMPPSATQTSSGQSSTSSGQSSTGVQGQSQSSSAPGQATDNTQMGAQDRSQAQGTETTQRRADGDGNTARRTRDNLTPSSSPERQTEFQRLIAATTGQQLLAYGADLFQGAPSTFAPVENIPVTPDYVIGPGDELRLQIWGQVNQQGSYLVSRNGQISIPQLGPVQVAGVHYADLSEFLRSQLSRVYRNFDLNVTLGQLRSIQVFVVGQARQPGSYTISSLSTLLNALFVTGGPSAQGTMRDIQVRRGTETITHFDLYDLLLKGDKSRDVKLLPGDVIFIPAVGPQVALVGSVNNPAIYELRGQTGIGDLLHLSGGESNVAAGSQVRLERIYRHELRSVLQVGEAELPSTPMQNGDIVTVTSIIDRFKNAVTLRGNVANPGRFLWHPGMRVTDLIPNKDVLVTRDYWDKRNRLALPAPADAEPKPAGSEGSLQISSSPGPGTGSTNAPRTGTSSSGGGSSVAAALSASDSLFTPKTDVLLSAPDIDWSYAVIERQNPGDLKTTLIPFNLGRAVLDGDPTQNPELMANDVVSIFSTADIRVPTAQQTRFVRLEGEFAGAGVYSVRPGESLRQLVMRAGGFTPDAYLYASEFTRQSTRRVERQRLNDYADQLAAQVSTVTASNSARALNDRDAAAAEQSATGARSAIGRLRQMEPVGRIVLQFKPDSEGIDSLPDMALEDGDRFIVPKIPANVYVEGQVYSANAFVFKPGRRTSAYLKLAGGPDREADRSRAFILRADGSVLSRQYSNFEHALIYPGDTIVVPPNINKRAILRDLVDISNIIGQFGIGVAAINVLR